MTTIQIILAIVLPLIALWIATEAFKKIHRAFIVPEGYAGLLYRKGKFAELLGPGRHVRWGPFLTLDLSDVRKAYLAIAGQEVLTADNVGLKLSLFVSPTQRREAQTFDSAGASPATRTILKIVLVVVRRPRPRFIVQMPRTINRNVNRTSVPDLFAKQCAPRQGSVVQVHGIPRLSRPPHCARSSKRTVRLISGIALDECRGPERYRTRAPISQFSPPRSSLRISFVTKSCRGSTGGGSIFRSRSPIAETRRRERRQCRCKSCREHSPAQPGRGHLSEKPVTS